MTNHQWLLLCAVAGIIWLLYGCGGSAHEPTFTTAKPVLERKQ